MPSGILAGVRLRPDSDSGSKAVRPRAPRLLLERQASDELKRARNRGAVDGAESVSLRQIPLRVVRQVRNRPIGQASEVHRAVEARELDFVEQVEDIESNLELRPMRNRDIFRDRQVEIVERWITREEPRCFVAIAARLRRSEALRVAELPVR